MPCANSPSPAVYFVMQRERLSSRSTPCSGRPEGRACFPFSVWLQESRRTRSRPLSFELPPGLTRPQLDRRAGRLECWLRLGLSPTAPAANLNSVRTLTSPSWCLPGVLASPFDKHHAKQPTGKPPGRHPWPICVRDVAILPLSCQTESVNGR